MKTVCDVCGQVSTIVEPGTPCPLEHVVDPDTGPQPCTGIFRDPSVEYSPPGLPPEAPTNHGKRKPPQLSSKSAEHYTPPEIIEVVRRTFGGISTDPASCEKANTIVKALHFYTKEDNGLTKPWPGLVFCNPPGGFLPGTRKSQAQAFFFKAVEEWQAERATAVLFLGFTLELLRLTQERSPSACDFAFCVLRERTCFLDEDLKPQEDPTHANVLILISRDVKMIKRFYIEAQTLGAVVVNADLVT